MGFSQRPRFCLSVQTASCPLASGTKAGNQLLLIADSHVGALHAIRQTLERGALQWQIVGAESARHAMAFARSSAPTAVLADFRLSDMSGLRLLLQLKSIQPDMLTLMMSACGSDQARDLCHQAGIDGFVDKPLDVGALCRWLEVRTADS